MVKKPEVISLKLPTQQGEYQTKLYKGFRSKHGLASNYDEVIVLAPGLLGSGTLHFAASSLARAGHDVAVVSHGKTSVFHPNQDRSKHVHFTAKAATLETKKRGVILLGHSNGNQDIHHAAIEALKRQRENPGDRRLYHIMAIGAVAGAGLSGRHINGQEMYKETVGLVHDLLDHPVEELDVVGRSAANFIRHPLLSIVEAIGAACCDVRVQASTVIAGDPLRAFNETYLRSDGVIPLPHDRTDYERVPGSHNTPLVCSDTIIEIAERLYEDNDPRTLQIAQHLNRAA